MDTLYAMLNNVDNLLPPQGGRSFQPGKLTAAGRDENRSFAEVYKKLASKLPKAANEDGQAADMPLRLARLTARQDEQGKSNIAGIEAGLTEFLSTWPLLQSAPAEEVQPGTVSLAMNAAATPSKSAQGKSFFVTDSLEQAVKNRSLAAAPSATAAVGNARFAIDGPPGAGNQEKAFAAPAGQSDKAASSVNFKATPPVYAESERFAGQGSNSTGKTLAAPAGLSNKAASAVNFKATPPASAESGRFAGQGSKVREMPTAVANNAAAIPPGNPAQAENANLSSGTTLFDWRTTTDWHMTSSRAMDPERSMNPAAMLFTENIKTAASSLAVQSPPPIIVAQRTTASAIINGSAQVPSHSPEAGKADNGKSKLGLAEPRRSFAKEISSPAVSAPNEQGAAESLQVERPGTSVNKATGQANGNESRFSGSGEKNANQAGEILDSSGKFAPMPSLYSSPAIGEKSRADQPLMANSQIDLITNNMANHIKQGSSNLEIDLHPEALGKIKLMFQLEDGSLMVRIIAHTEEACHLLDANLQSIKDGLSQQGIKISDMSLDLANQQGGGNQTSNEHRESGRPARTYRETPENHDAGRTEEPALSQHSRLNLLA